MEKIKKAATAISNIVLHKLLPKMDFLYNWVMNEILKLNMTKLEAIAFMLRLYGTYQGIKIIYRLSVAGVNSYKASQKEKRMKKLELANQ